MITRCVVYTGSVLVAAYTTHHVLIGFNKLYFKFAQLSQELFSLGISVQGILDAVAAHIGVADRLP